MLKLYFHPKEEEINAVGSTENMLWRNKGPSAGLEVGQNTEVHQEWSLFALIFERIGSYDPVAIARIAKYILK